MESFNDRIAQLRKSASMTQEALAQKLGVTFQAVSKWETGAGYPDVTLLPKIAAIFGTTVDHLLGGPAPEAAPAPAAPAAPVAPAAEAPSGSDATEPAAGTEPAPDVSVDVPGDLEIRVFCKGKPVGEARVAGTVHVRVFGRARDIRCEASLACGTVEGDVSVGNNLDCRGDIGGDVKVGGHMRVKGDIGGDVKVDGHLACYGDIGGDVQAGSVEAGDIGGDVEAETVTAGEIGGDVDARTVKRHRNENRRWGADRGAEPGAEPGDED